MRAAHTRRLRLSGRMSLETAGIEEIDQSGDEEIGVLVLGSGGEEPGDAVNQETLRILGERGLPVRMLEEEADESGEETDTAEEADESGEETDTAEEAEGGGGPRRRTPQKKTPLPTAGMRPGKK